MIQYISTDGRVVLALVFDSRASRKTAFANSEDPDETPHDAASHLGLRCLLKGISETTFIKTKGYVSRYCQHFCKASVLGGLECLRGPIARDGRVICLSWLSKKELARENRLVLW
ncbi:hypothetical protein DPMN_001397 [Dreissena polymorpha]|uniref:Uncharacterized protein n=1 Tax=Dreissena polymorpha TaxID=45954 RepID=A0A9D4MKU7_DREPO|nr:hypothetical protein DPMN_001397 [Dreissena polymorpha]